MQNLDARGPRGGGPEYLLGWVTGLEPAASGATVRRSNQLSYTHHVMPGTPGGIRTPDLEIRSLPLYPTELRAHALVDSRLPRSATVPAPTLDCQWSGRRDSNPQQSAWKAEALPIELRPHPGRAGRIRTGGPLLPKQVRYQAAPRPDCARPPGRTLAGRLPEGKGQYRFPHVAGQMPSHGPGMRTRSALRPYARPCSSASRNARRAAPRWLIAFFSARSSSAMRRPGVASGAKSGS